MPGAHPPGRSGKGAGWPGGEVFLKYSDERGFSPFARLSLEISTSGRWVSGGGATPHPHTCLDAARCVSESVSQGGVMLQHWLENTLNQPETPLKAHV